MKKLDGLTFPKRLVTHLGCIRECLRYQGRDIDWPWLYGGTGHAFIINMQQDVDLESVTAWSRRMILDLAPNLGFSIEGFGVNRDEAGEAWRARQKEAWDFVRERIDRGRPCYGWELKAPYGDFWLITGYDAVGYYYAGWKTGGPTPWNRLGELFIQHLEVRAVELREPAAPEKVVRDALTAAIGFAKAPREWFGAEARQGPEAFEVWAKALEAGRAQRDHHSYQLQVWLECRTEAVAFLREAKRRLPGRCDGRFDEAAGHYDRVCAEFRKALELHPPRKKANWHETFAAPDAAEVMRAAGQADAKGLECLGKIVDALK